MMPEATPSFLLSVALRRRETLKPRRPDPGAGVKARTEAVQGGVDHLGEARLQVGDPWDSREMENEGENGGAGGGAEIDEEKTALGAMFEAAQETGLKLTFGKEDFSSSWHDQACGDSPAMSGLFETRSALSKIREVAHTVFHEKQPCSSLMIPPYKWWGIKGPDPGLNHPLPLPNSGCGFEALASQGRVPPVFLCTPPNWSPLSGTLGLLPKTLSRLLAFDGIECSLSSEYATVNSQLAAGALAVISVGDTDEDRMALQVAATEGKHAVHIQAEGVGDAEGAVDDVSRVRLPLFEVGKEETLRESEDWARLVRCIKASCCRSCPRRKPQVFVSCNTANSEAASRDGICSRHVGSKWADPAQIRLDLENRKGRSVWLDTDHSGYLSKQGLFNGKASALSHSDIVVICMSNEYASSHILAAECMHALDHLGKRAVVCLVGTKESSQAGNRWEDSELGLLVRGLPLVDFRDCSDEGKFIERMDELNGLVHELALDVLDEARHWLAEAKKDRDEARRQSATAKRTLQDAHGRHEARMCDHGKVKDAEEHLGQCEMKRRGTERLVEIAIKGEARARERLGSGSNFGVGSSGVDERRRLRVRLSGMRAKGLVCDEGSGVSLRLECVPSGGFKGRTKGTEVGPEGDADWRGETARFECALGSLIRVRVMTIPGKGGGKGKGGATKGKNGSGGGALLGEATIPLRMQDVENTEGEKTSCNGWHAIRSSHHGESGEVMIRIETAEVIKRREPLVYREDKTMQTDPVALGIKDGQEVEPSLPRRKGWGEGWFDQKDEVPPAPIRHQVFGGPVGWRKSMAGGRLHTPRGLRPSANPPSLNVQQQQQQQQQQQRARRAMNAAAPRPDIGAGEGGWNTVYRALRAGGLPGGQQMDPRSQSGMPPRGAPKEEVGFALSPPKLRKYYQFVDEGDLEAQEQEKQQGKVPTGGAGDGGGKAKSPAKGFNLKSDEEEQQWGEHWSKVGMAKKLLLGDLEAQDDLQMQRGTAWLQT